MTLPEHEFTLYGKKYRMREAVGYEDASLVSTAQNSAELWIRRISKSIIEPAMGTEDLKLLSNKVFAALIEKWVEYNEPKPADFLELPTTTPEPSTSCCAG